MTRIHPITGMALEDGYGALPDDEQAVRIHVPYLEQWFGKAAADAMRARLAAHDIGPAPEPQPEPVAPAEPPHIHTDPSTGEPETAAAPAAPASPAQAAAAPAETAP